MGGFVGGELRSGLRRKDTVINRCLLTLDADYADEDFWEQIELFFNLDEFYEKFNVNFKHKYNNILDKLKNLNLIIEQNNNIALTQRGRELSNTVFIEFID